MSSPRHGRLYHKPYERCLPHILWKEMVEAVEKELAENQSPTIPSIVTANLTVHFCILIFAFKKQNVPRETIVQTVLRVLFTGLLTSLPKFIEASMKGGLETRLRNQML